MLDMAKFDGATQPPKLRRFYAALALKGVSLSTMAHQCKVSDSHLRSVAIGDRKPSDRLVANLRAELGEGAWRFVAGEVDLLVAEPLR